ncbi:MAG: tetratricopeptide repeat protein [Hydrogenophilaceae bacterium]
MGTTTGSAKELPGLDVMADKLAKRLEMEPADGEGWALLARTYLELGKTVEADAAYAKALALRPDDPLMKADYQAARKALLPAAR